MGFILNGTKYVHLHNENHFKELSLEDNIYFTLRDIFLNCSGHEMFEANHYLHQLSGGVRFEERNESFAYTDFLRRKCNVTELYYWISTECEFEFTDISDEFDEDGKVIINDPFVLIHTPKVLYEYIKYEVWLKSVKNLLSMLEARKSELVD